MGECIMAGHPQGGGVKYGTYTGNGAATKTISLGITPKWVLVFRYDGFAGTLQSTASNYYGGLALVGNPAGWADPNYIVKIVDGGFAVANIDASRIMSNMSGTKYYYIYGM